jgi:gamma-glutamylcyclotransferase (GGCT)/AIG2-like uncharacterized protein YtfP
MSYLFAYGTFMRGLKRNRFLVDNGCEYVGDAELDGFELFNVVGKGYPYIIPGRGRVKGEVWNAPYDVLPKLDEEKDVGDGLYTRETVRTRDGIECFTYVWGGRQVPVMMIHTGDFRRSVGK